jgi:hypothetical protein
MTDLRTELADARNVLLCAPSMSGDERGACTDLLVPDDPDEATVLWVSFRRDPRACVDQWVDATGDQPRDGGVIFVSESGATDVDGVIGEAEGDPVVCVDSLTAMLQYVTVETAYEFLHTITGQLYAADASAHFHIDPTAHDDQTVDSIASLFDAVVTLGGDEPETRTRNVLE